MTDTDPHPDLTDRERELYHRFMQCCGRVHVASFWTILLPGFRIAGAEWAEAVVRGWT